MASKMSERLNFKSVEELLGVVNEEAAMDIEIYARSVDLRGILSR